MSITVKTKKSRPANETAFILDADDSDYGFECSRLVAAAGKFFLPFRDFKADENKVVADNQRPFNQHAVTAE